MSAPRPHDPRVEAQELPDRDLVARVLEPSPPADTSDGTVTWAELAQRDAQIAHFARVHWLGPRRRLTELPPELGASRDAIHQLAYFAIASKGYAASGKLGLRSTRGGLGTPFSESESDADELAPATTSRSASRAATSSSSARPGATSTVAATPRSPSSPRPRCVRRATS